MAAVVVIMLVGRAKNERSSNRDIFDILVSLTPKRLRDSHFVQGFYICRSHTMLSWKSLVVSTLIGHGCRWGKAVAATAKVPMSELCLSNGHNHNHNYSLIQLLLYRLGGVRGAKKKAGGSSTNGRESAGRRLGIKVWPNTFASE
jgi:Ribosomal L27 protein